MDAASGAGVAFTLNIAKTAWGWTECELFERLAGYLTDTGRPTHVVRASRFPMKQPGIPLLRWNRPIDDSFAYLQNDATRQFALLACDDWAEDVGGRVTAAARDPRCWVILKQQYRDDYFSRRFAGKVRPWTYLPSFPGSIESRLSELRGAQRSRPGLYFRGNDGHARRREILAALRARGVLASNDTTPIAFDSYLTELAMHRLVLSLPGWGNLCHREIEAFGAGTPVLMPTLRNRLHNDLRPNHHYIAVDVKEDASINAAGDAIAHRYSEVSTDAAFLARVAANAQTWYDENARYPANLVLTTRLLGLAT